MHEKRDAKQLADILLTLPLVELTHNSVVDVLGQLPSECHYKQG